MWGGFACALLAFSSLLHGTIEATGVLLVGAAVLFAWAAWLHHHEH